MHEKLSGRQAAKLIGAAAAGVFLPDGHSCLLAAEKSLPKIVRTIPKTGEKLPVIGLGSALTFDVPSRSPKARQVAEVMTLFVKFGGKLIDTSPAYGNAESLIGEIAFKSGLRDSLFFATKVWTRSVEEGVTQMERSLQRFRARTIDLMQVHNLADVDREMTSLRDWK